MGKGHGSVSKASLSGEVKPALPLARSAVNGRRGAWRTKPARAYGLAYMFEERRQSACGWRGAKMMPSGVGVSALGGTTKVL
jgi:hypothetical protein